MAIVKDKENVDHPPYYTMGGIEVIDVIEAWELPFHLGCVLKYMARARHKWEDYPPEEELQDYNKMIWYMMRYLVPNFLKIFWTILEWFLASDVYRHDGFVHIAGILFHQKKPQNLVLHVVFQNHLRENGNTKNLNMKVHHQKFVGRNNLKFIDLAMRRFKRRQAIKIIEDSKDSHVGWLEFLEENPDYSSERIELVGDIKWQKQCISDYNIVLDFLREE